MNISQMLALLTKLAKEHRNVEVFFDCPNCKQSFTPGSLHTVALHLTEKEK